MAIELGSAYVSILPETSKLAPGIESELSGIGRSATSSGSSAGSGWVSGFGSAVGRWAKRGALAGALGIGAGITVGVKTAADLEQLKIGFTTMLGSAKAANDFLGKIKRTAAATPFELPGLAESSQKLLAFGFQAKDVIPTLTTLGDAASGLGLGQDGLNQIILAVGQIQAKGKVQSDELLQLTEAGIPALKILANGFGVSTAEMQKMVTDGLVPANKAIPKLLDGIKHGTKGAAGQTAAFGGLMKKQSKSLTGLFSTLKDTVSVGLAGVVKPFLPFVKQGLSSAIKILGPLLHDLAKHSKDLARSLKTKDVKEWTNTVGRDFLGKVKSAAPALKDFFSNFRKGLDDSNSSMPSFVDLLRVGGVVIGFLAKHSDLLAKALPLLVAGIVAYKAAQAAANVAATLAVPTKIAEVVVNRQLVKSNRELIASRVGLTGATEVQTGAENVGMLTRARSVVGMVAQKVATIAVSAATKAWTAGQWLLNAALSANPIGLVVLAIVALVAGIVIAYKKSETFRNIVQGAFEGVKVAAEAVASFFTKKIPAAFGKVKDAAGKAIGWVRHNWPKILAILTGPFGLATLFVVNHFGQIRGAATKVVGWVKDKFGDLVGFVRGLPGKIAGAARGMFHGISDAFRSAVNFIIDGWNGLSFHIPGFDPPGPGPKFGGFDLSLPDVPRLAKGGILTSATLAIAGEAGPEAVIPLDRLDHMLASAGESNRDARHYAGSKGAGSTAAKTVPFVITNWKTGEGYFREVAEDTFDGRDDYDGTTRRMR